MRSFQFWVLLLGSFLVSGLLIKQTFVSKALIAEQRIMVDNQEIASTGAAYQNTWKELAVHIYQASRQDPPLAAVLKTERVTISSTPPASVMSTNSASSKAPVPPPTPGTP